MDLEERLKTAYAEYLNNLNIHLVRSIARQVGVDKPTYGKKEELINKIINVLLLYTPAVPTSNRGAPLKEKAPDPKYILELEQIKKDILAKDAEKIKNELYFEENTLSVASDGGRPRYSPETLYNMEVFYLLKEENGASYLVDKNGNKIKNYEPVPSQILSKYHLVTGDKLRFVPEKHNDKSCLSTLYEVNGDWRMNSLPVFEEQKTIAPVDRVLFLEQTDKTFARVFNLFLPLTFGSRVLVTSPVGCDYVKIYQSLKCQAISADDRKTKNVFMLSETSPDQTRCLQIGEDDELITTSFNDDDQTLTNKVDFSLGRVKNLCLKGFNVFFFVNFTHTLLHEHLALVKNIFSIARKIEKGGSITVFCTVDQDLAKEFDFFNQANTRVTLSKQLALEHVYPPVDLKESYTFREEELVEAPVLSAVAHIRKIAFDEGNERAYQNILEPISYIDLIKKYM